MLRILHEREENYFEGIAAGDEFLFHCSSIPIRPQNVCTIADRCHSNDVAGHRDEASYDNDFLHRMRTNLTQQLTKRKQIQPDIFCRLHFPDLKRENVNFHRRIPHATFWVHVDNSLCHNKSKVAPKFERHLVSRSPHSPYSPNINPCDFWFFGIGVLKGILKDREFNSSGAIEGAITKVWDKVTFDEVQSVFHNWMIRLAWVIENEEEYMIKK
jgi:hypothetical protein